MSVNLVLDGIEYPISALNFNGNAAKITIMGRHSLRHLKGTTLPKIEIRSKRLLLYCGSALIKNVL